MFLLEIARYYSKQLIVFEREVRWQIAKQLLAFFVHADRIVVAGRKSTRLSGFMARKHTTNIKKRQIATPHVYQTLSSLRGQSLSQCGTSEAGGVLKLILMSTAY